MIKLFLLTCFVSLGSFVFVNKEAKRIDVKVTAEEAKLYQLIIAYRKENGLPLIPLSSSLTYVAQQHCLDLVNNAPDTGKCNTHSWSSKGSWSACCYTPDHQQAACMWGKPKELTKYTGNGFEIACGSSNPMYKDFVMTAVYALAAWKKSEGHNNVIINRDGWKTNKWNAIGVGIYKGFATVWFGDEADVAGEPAGPN